MTQPPERFATTQWSMVRAAGAAEHPASQKAFSVLYTVASDTESPADWLAACRLSAVTWRFWPSPTRSAASATRCRVGRTPALVSHSEPRCRRASVIVTVTPSRAIYGKKPPRFNRISGNRAIVGSCATIRRPAMGRWQEQNNIEESRREWANILLRSTATAFWRAPGASCSARATRSCRNRRC